MKLFLNIQKFSKKNIDFDEINSEVNHIKELNNDTEFSFGDDGFLSSGSSSSSSKI